MAKNLKSYFTSKEMYFFVRQRKDHLYNVLHWKWEQNTESQQQFQTYATYTFAERQYKGQPRCPIPIPVWLQYWPQLPFPPVPTFFGYLLFKFSFQHLNVFLSARSLKINQEGRKDHTNPRIKKQKILWVYPLTSRRRRIRTTKSWEISWGEMADKT